MAEKKGQKDRKNRRALTERGRLPEIPADWKWVLMFLVLIILPQKSDWWTFISSPEDAYGEIRLHLPDKTVVIGKNSGSRRVALLAKAFQMHACQLIRGKDAFLAVTPGSIPPSSYSVAVFSASASEAKTIRVRLDDDSEFEPQALRITTPVEENQYVMVVIAVIFVAAGVAAVLRDYYRRDDAAMTGRRS
jgi:hypothetical protein